MRREGWRRGGSTVQMVELKEGMGRNGRKETDTPVSCEQMIQELTSQAVMEVCTYIYIKQFVSGNVIPNL